ncbi:MAG: restriction endonuclease subunit S [Thiobacillus sp.]
MERFELPEGWEWRALGDSEVTSINPRKSEVRNLADEKAITFVPMDAVSEELGTIAKPGTRLLGDVRKGYTYFADGDVIFAKITPCMENGKSAIARGLINGVGFGSTEFHVFRAGTRITPEWLHCLLRSQQLRTDAKNAMTGAAGQQRVPRDFLADYEIPIPPLPEQQRLVARIEAQTNRTETIRKAQRELVTELRGILNGYYAEICANAEWKPLSDVAPQVRRPVSVEAGKSYPELGIRSFGKGTFHKPAIAAEQLGSKRIYHIHPGDLIFNNVFGWEGAVAVVKPEDAGRVGSHRFITCVPKANVATTPFLYFHFTTEQGLHDLGDASPGGAGRNRTLGLTALGNIRVPVPDYDKQVVFTRLWEKVETTRRLQTELASDLAAYVPSLLAKAFRGEL